MYLILSDVNDSATSSRDSEVFHDGVDVTGLRATGEEKVHWRRSVGEGPMEKGCRRRGLSEKSPPLDGLP